jgi:hypothetical protein
MDDYRKDIVETRTNRQISHPKTGACPKGPRRILTNRPMKVIIRPVPRKDGKAFEKAWHLPMNAFYAFRDRAKTKVETPLSAMAVSPAGCEMSFSKVLCDVKDFRQISSAPDAFPGGNSFVIE